MSYFPAFIKLDDKKIVLVGGGAVAFEKLEKLLDFTDDIFIVALEFSDDIMTLIDANSLKFEKRHYELGDIDGASLVIVAVDDISLQESIYIESQSSKCLCNAVDSVDYCDFIFPSYIKEDDLTIAVSTSGASPAFAKHFRIYLQGLIPQGLSNFLKEMKSLRNSLPKGKERMKMLDAKAKKYIESI